MGKPDGCLVLVNLTPGVHRLSLRSRGYQEEWVELTAGRDTQEVDITMKPGEDYPFRQTVTRLELTVTRGGAPASALVWATLSWAGPGTASHSCSPAAGAPPRVTVSSRRVTVCRKG